MQYIGAAERPLFEGQVIDRGAFTGYSGNTGWSCGPHLHVQIQLAPDNGGTTSWYNPSVQEYYWDTDKPYDPPYGASPVSANGTSSQPLVPERPSPGDRRDCSGTHTCNPDWDIAMRDASHPEVPKG